LNDFEDKLLAWLGLHGLFEGVGRILLAVSGGADSVAMAAALHRLRQAGRLGCEFVIGHINHSLRGAESDADEAFVCALGKSLRVEVVTCTVDVGAYAKAHRLSIETAGRTLRLKALAAMARDNNCSVVATAHHADDQAETLVHRLMRGTGLRGLCGIRPLTRHEGVRFVRPLLTLRRAEIMAYCQTGGLSWREDASNRSCAFTRNRIRHRLMPELERQMTDAAGMLTRLAAVCCAAQQRIETAANGVTSVAGQGVVSMDRGRFVEQSPWVQAELLGWAVQTVGGGLRDMTSRHYQAVMAQAAAAGNTKIIWPGDISVAVSQQGIVLSKVTDDEPVFPLEPAVLQVNKTALFGPYHIHATFLERPNAQLEGFLHDKPAMTERLDADCIKGPIMMRPLEQGDRFWPMGLGKPKKAARFLMDSKIDKQDRENIFVLADAEKILWLAPLRLDDRVKVTASTRRILEIIIRFQDTETP